MKIITLWEPWASLIPLGAKKYETRSWSTSYRGTLLIHAAKRRIDTEGHDVLNRSALVSAIPEGVRIRYGEVVAIAELVDCIKMTQKFIDQQTPLEKACGDWQEGRFAWKLENVRDIKARITRKGKQGLMPAPEEVIEALGVSMI